MVEVVGQHNASGSQFLLGTIGGLVFSRLLEPFFFPWNLGSFSIHLGHIAAVGIVVSATYLYRRRIPTSLWFSLAIFFDQMAFLIAAREIEFGFFSPASWAASAALILLNISVYKILSRTKGMSAPDEPAFGLGQCAKTIISIVLVVAGFRVFQFLMLQADMPNEARSIVIGGLEIHHINLGVMLVWTAAMLTAFAGRTRKTRLITGIILTIGIGMMVDQLTYYALRSVSDKAYLELASTVGAVGGLVLVSIALIHSVTQKRA